ncbi:hypothetical protein KIW84_045330 [Lathyrus oleraceus]|uniref:Uncharacterized protein n=1 Tax=Pisum sativum TaxID=3888 RepID=A0A9D4XK04_PEA|nr:hypothetical protein KIW84_045330 [Pisum sativum]
MLCNTNGQILGYDTHIDNLVDSVANDNDTTPIENIVDSAETITNPHVETYDEPSGEPFIEPTTEPTVNVPVFDMHLNDILDEYEDSTKELRDEDPQNIEPHRIIGNVIKSQDKDNQEKDKEMVEVDEENETDEEPTISVMKSIILSQHPEVVHPEEAQSKKAVSLTFDYKLFVGIHVLYILVTKYQDQSVVGNSYQLSKSTKKDVFLELMEVSKALQETFDVSTIRKKNMDNFIKMMTMEMEVE